MLKSGVRRLRYGAKKLLFSKVKDRALRFNTTESLAKWSRDATFPAVRYWDYTAIYNTAYESL